MCDCGCNKCDETKPVMLNESVAPKEILSEGLKYHMDNNMPLTEHVYRAGSQKYYIRSHTYYFSFLTANPTLSESCPGLFLEANDTLN